MGKNPDQLKKKYTIGYYNKISFLYERMYSSYLQYTHSNFLSRLHLLPADRVLDISCGTGLLIKMMIDKKTICSEWVLNEPVADMLAKAKEQLKDHANISFTNYFAEDLDFPDHSFDKLICLNSFHYYTPGIKTFIQAFKARQNAVHTGYALLLVFSSGSDYLHQSNILIDNPFQNFSLIAKTEIQFIP